MIGESIITRITKLEGQLMANPRHKYNYLSGKIELDGKESVLRRHMGFARKIFEKTINCNLRVC
jgi:hypothetical protein